MKDGAIKVGWVQGVAIYAYDKSPRVRGSVLAAVASNVPDGPKDKKIAVYLHPDDVELLKEEAPKGWTPA